MSGAPGRSGVPPLQGCGLPLQARGPMGSSSRSLGPERGVALKKEIRGHVPHLGSGLASRNGILRGEIVACSS